MTDADPILKKQDKGPQVILAQTLLNRNGAILDPDGDFGSGTDQAVRELQGSSDLPVTGIVDSATWLRLRALPEPSPDIPARAVAFIGREEVGSRAMYDKQWFRPSWPGGESGVTIGVGYDLGYQGTFDADWSDLLSPQQRDALMPWIGKKGDAASGGPAVLTAIAVPWHAAWAAFIRRTLPQETQNTRTAFAKWDAMPSLCFGVLVSLVYNRGTLMNDKPGQDRRKEMRDIRDAVISGSLDKVPEALRSMKRLWPEGNGLRARREREAVLFEEGLAQG